ncbi:MAG TPA: bifunctional ornithine acetyltransferase/N-acetylglutamate synthase, partial [Halieaceae bacterium]|nr:bifunctional ornithine acetyltransferase/N-acetylglutamate synthase [Halieaceae bacterium]
MTSPELADALLPVCGLRLATVAAGVRYANRPDVVLLEAAPGSRCAAVFTRNAFCAAPVHLAREHLAQAAPRYLLINTGNANAGTGASGLADARACTAAVAEAAGVSAAEVLPFSTG